MTGYTYELIDKNLDFPKFALTCARAFGVCIMMRDDPIDVLPPEEFKPDSYHANAIDEVKKKIVLLKSHKSIDSKKRWSIARIMEQLEYMERHQKEEEEKNVDARLKAMLKKVEAWEAPSKDHEGLKKFMIQQLSDSIQSQGGGDNYYKTEIASLKEALKDPVAYHAKNLEKAQRDLKYHEEKWAEELRRVEHNNNWIKQLRESLKEEPKQ